MKKNVAIILILAVALLSACKQQENEPGADLRTYRFDSAEDVETISDDDLIYIVQHHYVFSDFMPEDQRSNIDLFGVPLAEDVIKGVITTEQISMMPFRMDANEKIDLEQPLSADTLQSYADAYCRDLIESANTYDGDTGSQTRDEEIIYCGENDLYAEYSIRYTELRTMRQSVFQNFYETSRIPRAYRRCFMKNTVSVAENDRTYNVYLGKVTPEAIQDEMDIFIAGNSIPVLYREVSETDEAVIYTYYEAYIVGGDHGMCDTANLVKTENTYDKLTHEEKQRVTHIKEIEIPETYD